MKKFISEETKEKFIEAAKASFYFGIFLPAAGLSFLFGSFALVSFLILNNLAWVLLFVPAILIFISFYGDMFD